MLDLLLDYRLELYAALILGFLVYLHRKYADNQIVAEYIRGAVNAVASRIENNPAEPDVNPDSPLAKKAALRKKVRRQIVKGARRANRGK